MLRLRGAYAIAVFCRDEPQRVVGARAGSPLVLGVGKGETFLASDAMALAGVTDQIVYLEEGDVVDVQLGKHWIVGRDDTRADGSLRPVRREVRTVQAHSGAAELGPYRHYMQKEIFEQPKAIADTLNAVHGVSPELFGDGAYSAFKNVDQVLILACGTSYYSGSVARYWLEGVAGIPTQRRDRQRVPLPRTARTNPRTLVVAISQSGETADTLAALKHARALGMTTHVDDLQRGQAVRWCVNAKFAYVTRAGAEVGVASTKAFTTQLVGLFLLTLALAQVRGRLYRRTGSRAPQGPAPSARGRAGRAGARAADRGLVTGLHGQGERALPRPRPALPDRARGRAEAEGDQLHPRRGLSGRRTQARPAGAGDGTIPVVTVAPNDAVAGKAEEQHAGSARPRRRVLRALPTPTRTSRAARACT